MAVELSEKVKAAIEEPNFWHVATVNPDGSPQVTTMWVALRDGRIVLNTAIGRKKDRNLTGNAKVALSFSPPDSPYNAIAIQGRVVETYDGAPAEADIDSLAKKYIGQDVYPWRGPDEHRRTFVVEPTHVYHLDR